MKVKTTGVGAAPAFDKQAEGFGLTLERKSFVAGEHEDLGAFLATEAPGAYVRSAKMTGKGDDERIKDTVQRLETAHPDDAAGLFNDTVTDPFHIFTSDGMKQVTSSNMKEMKESPSNKSKAAKHPPKKPREVSVENLQVTHLGRDRASATYCTEENCANGEVHRHNVVSYLHKGDAGWRVICTSHKQP